MKAPSLKTALILSIATACAAVSSTAFAKVHVGKEHGYTTPDPLVNRPAGPALTDPNCAFALDWRCPGKDTNGG